MIFPTLKVESLVQVNDKTRLDGVKSFITTDEAAITLVEIEPESSNGFIDVTSDKFLDWSYSTAGDKTATIRITTDGAPISVIATFTVVSVNDDALFSNDQDIVSHEVDIYRFLRAGRQSFLDFHRIAQGMILDELDQRGLTDTSGNRLTKLDIYDVQEVKEWSRYLSLYLIFKSVQGEIDDVYDQKSKTYWDMAQRQSTRATIRLDLNQDGTVDSKPDLVTGRLVRR